MTALILALTLLLARCLVSLNHTLNRQHRRITETFCHLGHQPEDCQSPRYAQRSQAMERQATD
jgi:hypothetical protein